MKNLIIQRHGNAEPGDNDVARPLSDLGRRQAERIQKDFVRRGLAGADIVLSSPATRAVETVALDGNVVVLPELYIFPDEEGMDELSALFARLGYATPGNFLMEDTSGHLRRWASRAAQTVMARTVGAETVRVGCHAPLSCLLALEFIPGVYVDLREQLLELRLGEACAIVIGCYTSTLTFQLIEP